MKSFTKTAVLTLAPVLLSGAAHADLVITEAMSNSSHPGGAANGDWWELTNTGPSAVDLENYYWDDGDGYGVDGALFPPFPSVPMKRS